MICSKKTSGFTLIEVLIAITIVGMMMVTVIPYMQRMQTGYERKQFIARLNATTQLAWQNAIISGAVHRVLFDLKARTAAVERDVTKSAQAKQVDFKPIQGVEGATMSWPASIEIKQFFIGGFDELKRFSGKKSETIWFYVIPDGMMQTVTINAIDKDELIDNRPRQFGLVLNPFHAQFKVYDAFQK